MTELAEIEAQAIDNPIPWAQAHIRQYLESDGAEVDFPAAERLILLYTIGRRTGRIRRTPVVQFPWGEDLVIIASMGGAPQHPWWYRNLVDNPQVWVRLKGELFEGRAEPLPPEERDRAWEMITTRVPAFAGYQEKTDRVIPVVRITRV